MTSEADGNLIYLDYNASTPIAPEVVAMMEPYLHGSYGNPSSLHWAARGAHEAVECARARVGVHRLERRCAERLGSK